MKFFVRLSMLVLTFASTVPASATGLAPVTTLTGKSEAQLDEEFRMNSLIEMWSEEVRGVLGTEKTAADRRAVAENIRQTAMKLTPKQQIILVNNLIQLTEHVAFSLRFDVGNNNGTAFFALFVVANVLRVLSPAGRLKYAAPAIAFSLGVTGAYLITKSRAEDLYVNAMAMRSELLSVRLSLQNSQATQNLN